MAEVIAFIPVRGGSQSIPLKNIRSFCGKPLVYWAVKALQNCVGVDRIVVATDSPEIEEAVLGFGFGKVEVYHRSAESATNTAPTEAVMLEYLCAAHLPLDSLFVLVQATSPLTETRHFDEAFALYRTGGYDSLLSVVRSFRFFWTEVGTSVNYDYLCRPRRQDFSGSLMENGAFYINTVSGILSTGNRLCGRIGLYEMPDYTATEIDEVDDWMILESLMRTHHSHFQQSSGRGNVKLFLTDVDGVLTDCGMYYSSDGTELKKFNTRDGMAFRLLREAGIKTGILTSEDTSIVSARSLKLHADHLYQGLTREGKLAAALDICRLEGISLSETAYIGDDLNCLDLLRAAGHAACPQDAANEVKQLPGIRVLQAVEGGGAVREWVEQILYDSSLKSSNIFANTYE